MIKKETIPVPPFKGLYLDDVTVPGGLSKAENVTINPDGSATRRLFERTLADTETCQAGMGTKEVYELMRSDGKRFIFADIDYTGTGPTAFGAEGVANFAGWTDPGASWGYASSKWTHVSGTTSLVATGETAIVAAAQYRVTTSIACPAVSTVAAGWTYASVDSTYDWVGPEGDTQIVWLNTWTHTSVGSFTTPLTAVKDFTPTAGESYVIKLHVTHTSGTGLTVSIGGKTAGVIASTGYHTFIVRYLTNATPLKFTPSADWVGSINKTWPRWREPLDNWCSVVQLIDPAGPDTPSNYDRTVGTHVPKELYLDGAELLNVIPRDWYPEVAATSSQSLAVYLGGTLCGIITESGTYSYDITATNTTALTFTPTTAWGGDITAASVQPVTQTSATYCKVIGGEVTGTTDYEVTWADVLTKLSTGDTVHPCWTTLQDRAFRVDGSNQNVWVEDISTPGTIPGKVGIGFHALGVPPPADAPLTASTTTGDITADDYNVAYTYVKKYGTYVVEGNPSPLSHITVAGSAINVSVIACTESDVTNIRIYRTLYKEQGGPLYLDREVENANDTVKLISSDDDIGDGTVLEYDNDQPPQGKFVLGAGSRLWLVDTNDVLHWSKLDSPEHMPAANYMTFDKKDGDEVMGLCPLLKDLLVFKRRRTWNLDMFSESTDDSGNVMLAKNIISSSYGCIASGSIQSVGTNAAIWLSAAGFLLYDGGTIRNISGGDSIAPSRIQSVVMDFLANGAEHYIDSVYHTASQLYHVNLLTRSDANSDGKNDTIDDQRHFVYSLLTDTWTEYVYRNTSGVKMYETNLALAHDSLGNEVILIPYLVTTTGTVTYVYQSEYEKVAAAQTAEFELMDSAGDGVTALDGPSYSFTDTSDNVYVMANSGFFKITSAGVKSCIATGADIITEWAETVASFAVRWVVEDLTNNCIYASLYHFNYTQSYYAVFKITFAGAISLIKKTESKCYGGEIMATFALNTAKTIMFLPYWDDSAHATPRTVTFLKITDPGGAGQTDATYDSFTIGYTGSANWLNIDFLKMYGDNLYFAFILNASANMKIGKYTDITGIAALTYIDTGLSFSDWSWYDNMVVSDTEIYILLYGTAYHAYKVAYVGSSWEITDAATLTGTISPIYNVGHLKKNTAGKYILYGVGDSFYIYDANWTLERTVSPSASTANCGISYYQGDASQENIFITCGYTSDNVYEIYPDGYWEIAADEITDSDTEATLSGTVADIVSNYTDLGTPSEKRICRAYLPVESRYATCGAFTLEPGYSVNVTTHTDAETTEPSGATSLRPFAHAGCQTWKYTNNQFSSTTEQWQDIRLDVGANGKMFRYSIRVGDITGANPGRLKIRPPFLEAQIKGQQ